jgi:signal transduction histidine kinase
MRQDISALCANVCDFSLQGPHCRLLQGSPIATFVIDENHTIILWNQACEYVTGFGAGEMVGTNRQWMPFYRSERPVMADLIVDGASGEELSRHYGASWQQSAIIKGAFESEDYFPEMGTGGTWLFFTASLLIDANGRITGAIETLQDITKRKRAEEALLEYRGALEVAIQQRTSELHQAHLDLAAKAEILEQANEELSQYAFVASHDLRAPLPAARNYADFLREELEPVLDDEQRGYFQGLFSALRNGDELVNDLLEFSRIGNLAVTLQDINLGAFFGELRSTLDLAEDTDLHFSTDWPTVRGDRILLNQIFHNLITNGLRFNRSPRRRVEITLSGRQCVDCEVSVHDNGIGIDPRFHDRIFKMFKRLHTHKEFAGTGIGLAIVRKAVNKLNGSVRLESSVGKGSTFFITLPLAGKDTECES